MTGRVTPIYKRLNNLGYAFRFIKGSHKINHSYNTKLEAMVAYDSIIIKLKLNQKLLFPLDCVIPDYYSVRHTNN